MKKPLLILTASALALSACTETRVIHDNSVTAQFTRLEGNSGARVTLGDGSAQAKDREEQRAKLLAGKPDTYNPNFQPLKNATWSTNFKVDQTSPNAPNVVPSAPPPPANAPLMGGIPLPETSGK